MENTKKTIDFLECDFWSQDWFFKNYSFGSKKKNPDDNYRLIIIMDNLSP